MCIELITSLVLAVMKEVLKLESTFVGRFRLLMIREYEYRGIQKVILRR